MIELAEESTMPDSFEKLLAIEAKIQEEKRLNQAAVEELRKDIKDVLEKITELIPLLETAKSISILAKATEKVFIWLAKVSAGAAIIYGAYKFGLSELADKVKPLVGK